MLQKVVFIFIICESALWSDGEDKISTNSDSLPTCLSGTDYLVK